MIRNYVISGNNETPTTKIISFIEFTRHRKATIQEYILNLLGTTDTGLSCRDISDLSGIWVQSLTLPLKSLVVAGKLQIVGISKSSVSNRMVQLYGIGLESKIDAL